MIVQGSILEQLEELLAIQKTQNELPPNIGLSIRLAETTKPQVQTIMGVPRVNGDLAVSRAFGDAQHKKTGGPKQDRSRILAE